MGVYWHGSLQQSEYGPLPIRLVSTHEQRLRDMALLTNTLPGARLQEIVRPPLPQVVRDRARLGYERGAPTITDILGTDRLVPTFPNDFSGSMGSYSGSSVNTGYNPMG